MVEYPEFTLASLKKLGWDRDLTEAEMATINRINPATPDAVSWSLALSGGIQRIALMHGCVPYGNGTARMNAFGLPDPIPVHREPIYTPGGWQVPYLMRDGFYFPGGTMVALPQLVVVLLQMVSYTVKLALFCWLQVLIRWSMPRYRYDQVMRLGWKGLLPIGLLNVLVTGAVVLALQG